MIKLYNGDYVATETECINFIREFVINKRIKAIHKDLGQLIAQC